MTDITSGLGSFLSHVDVDTFRSICILMDYKDLYSVLQAMPVRLKELNDHFWTCKGKLEFIVDIKNMEEYIEYHTIYKYPIHGSERYLSIHKCIYDSAAWQNYDLMMYFCRISNTDPTIPIAKYEERRNGHEYLDGRCQEIMKRATSWLGDDYRSVSSRYYKKSKEVLLFFYENRDKLEFKDCLALTRELLSSPYEFKDELNVMMNELMPIYLSMDEWKMDVLYSCNPTKIYRILDLDKQELMARANMARSFLNLGDVRSMYDQYPIMDTGFLHGIYMYRVIMSEYIKPMDFVIEHLGEDFDKDDSLYRDISPGMADYIKAKLDLIQL